MQADKKEITKKLNGKIKERLTPFFFGRKIPLTATQIEITVAKLNFVMFGIKYMLSVFHDAMTVFQLYATSIATNDMKQKQKSIRINQ